MALGTSESLVIRVQSTQIQSSEGFEAGGKDVRGEKRQGYIKRAKVEEGAQVIGRPT